MSDARGMPRVLLPVLAVLGVITLLAATQPPATPGATPAAPPASCAATPAATPGASAPSRVVSVTDTVTIHLTDHGFEPAHVEATNGHPLTIHLVNTGHRTHGFHLDHFDIDVRLAPGASRTVTVTSPDLGDYPFTSDEPCDVGMRGLLTFYI